VTAVKLVVGTLLLAFAALELHPRAGRLAFPPRLLPLGGLLSGFFGGLSGHQGALRTAFLVRLGLAKEAFIATGVMCAVLIDLARLPVYAHRFRTQGLGASAGLVATAAAAAFVGSLAGRAWLPKLTTRGLRALVAVLLVLFGLALGAGIL
jgi:uncharacterized membrane protein YfcA